MSQCEENEECDCTCHADPEGEVDAHAMPCCMRCSHCGRMIEVCFWPTHSAACATVVDPGP